MFLFGKKKAQQVKGERDSYHLRFDDSEMNDDWKRYSNRSVSQLDDTYNQSASMLPLTNFRAIRKSYKPDSHPNDPTSGMRVMANCNGYDFPVTFTIDPYFRIPFLHY